MKFDIVRIAKTKRLDTPVHVLDLMVQPALEDRDTTKYKVLFGRVFYRTGVVNIEDMHGKSAVAKRPSGGSPPDEPRKRSPPSRYKKRTLLLWSRPTQKSTLTLVQDVCDR